MMDRRTMLRALIASGLAATIDPERLLWVPKQMIAVPAMPPVIHVGDWVHLTSEGQYQRISATTSIHGRLFIAFDTTRDRVRVWDTANYRRVVLSP